MLNDLPGGVTGGEISERLQGIAARHGGGALLLALVYLAHDQPDHGHAARLRGRVLALEATVKRLNRRATRAEGLLRTTIDDCRRQGQTLGRSLANAGYHIERRRADGYRLAASILRDRLREALRAPVDPV